MGVYEEANTETGELGEVTVEANNGRYGPYLTKTGADGKSETRSLASEDEIFTVDVDKAKELFAQPKYGRGRGRGTAKPPLRELGPDPETGKNVTIKDGFYGAYITDGETNRTVPKQYTAESIEPAEAFHLLAEKRAAGPSKRGRRKTTGAAAKKTAAKKSSTHLPPRRRPPRKRRPPRRPRPGRPPRRRPPSRVTSQPPRWRPGRVACRHRVHCGQGGRYDWIVHFFRRR